MKTQPTIDQLEGEIDEGMKAFVRLGRALSEICDRDLYREAGFKNLESYTLCRWGHRRSWAYQLMDAARIYGYLEAAGFSQEELPNSESPLRMMAKLSPDQCVQVWQQALQKSPRPTRILITNLLKTLDKY